MNDKMFYADCHSQLVWPFRRAYLSCVECRSGRKPYVALSLCSAARGQSHQQAAVAQLTPLEPNILLQLQLSHPTPAPAQLALLKSWLAWLLEL